MRGAVLYGPRDIRFEDRETPKIVDSTDAVLRLSATCVCGSDLWPYRGIQPITEPTPMGHEYCGIVEEVGSAVRSVKPGQFVVGSFATSDNTCPNCQYGYQSWVSALRLGCMGLSFGYGPGNGIIRREMQVTEPTIWKSKEVAHGLPAKDQPTGSPARSVLIPCSKQTNLPARSVPASPSSPALEPHGTPIHWARL